MATALPSRVTGGYAGEEVVVSRAAICVGLLLLAVTMFVNGANMRVNSAESFSVDWQVLLRLAVCGACGLYGLYYLPATFRYLTYWPVAPMTALLVWSMLTIPLAINRLHAISSLAAFGGIFLFMPALLRIVPLRSIIITAVVTLTLFLCATWFVDHFFPAIGREQYSDQSQGRERLMGLGPPTGIGRHAALLVAVSCVAYSQRLLRWYLFLPVFVFATVTLYFTHARMCALATIVMLAVYACRHLPIMVKIPLFCFGVPLFLSAALLGLNQHRAIMSLSRTGQTDEITSVNGRDQLWKDSVREIRERPLGGYGFGCQRFVIQNQMDTWADYDPHNTLLNVTLAGGVVAGFCFLLVIFGQLWYCWQWPCDFADLILVLIVVGGLTDAVLFKPVPPATTILFVAALFWRYFEPRRDAAGSPEACLAAPAVTRSGGVATSISREVRS